MRKEYTRKLKENGITLIALVITIIILLILAGVTIAALSGDNGILKNAGKAKEETEKSEIIEQIRLDIYSEMTNNTGKEPDFNKIEEIAKKYGEISGTNFYDKVLKTNKGNYEIKLSDIWETNLLKPGEIATEEKNKYETVTIPKGFTVSNIDGEKSINEGLVIYYIPEETETNESFWTADTNANGILDVQENYDQYVWIPVDGILWDEGTSLKDVTEGGKILLGRYVFDENGKIDEEITPKSIGENFDIEWINEEGNKQISSYTESTIGKNAVAKGKKDINSFIDSVRENKGYYIARYEAGVENGDLNISDMVTNGLAPNDNWTGWRGENIKVVSRAGYEPWDYVTQKKASELCQGLYSETGVYSDLINSYAWDTAVLFIQSKQKEEEIPYSRQVRLQESQALTGQAVEGTEKDVKCNIYDMSGNSREWSTETTQHPCVCRGGFYGYDTTCTIGRYVDGLPGAYLDRTFRSILYL